MTAPRDPLREKADLILEAWSADPDRDAAQMARAVIRLLDRAAPDRDLLPSVDEMLDAFYEAHIVLAYKTAKKRAEWLADPHSRRQWRPVIAAMRAALAPRPPETALPRDRIEALLSSSMPDAWNYAVNAALDIIDGMSWLEAFSKHSRSPETADAGALDAARYVDADYVVAVIDGHLEPHGAEDPAYRSGKEFGLRLAKAIIGEAPKGRDATPALDVDPERLAEALLYTFVARYGGEPFTPPAWEWARHDAGALLRRLRAAETPTTEGEDA